MAGSSFVSLGCGSSSLDAQTPSGRQTAVSHLDEPRPTVPGQRAGQAPRIVFAIVIDQLGSDALSRHFESLDARGALRTAASRGAYFERSGYPYANTLTAPGHVTIHTGVPPSISGIDGNSAWDAALQTAVPSVADPRHPVFGRETDGVTAGPLRLRVPTVAEALKQQTGGAAKVVSISVKDRSALLSVGRAAELVLWYDSKLGRFTSSSVWGEALPPWVERFQREHPLRELLRPWHALSAEEYSRRLGPDAAPGEGDFQGLGTTFPHGFEQVSDPWSALSITPQLSEYLIALTDAAIAEHGLGQDDTPDLVALSISGTDSAGHVFGPDSWEYVDHLVRVDRALGAWLARIEDAVPISVLITSDHGVAPLPETRPGQAGRIFPDEVGKRVEASLTRTVGRGPWLAGVLAPYLFLSARARAHPRAAELRAAALAALREEPWLRGAWLLSEVRGWNGGGGFLESSLAASVAPDVSADIMFVSHPYQVLDLGLDGKGTNHGSPYDYDRHVPVLAWGVGVPVQRRSEPVRQLAVAPTLAALLRCRPPDGAALPPLF